MTRTYSQYIVSLSVVAEFSSLASNYQVFIVTTFSQ